MARIKTIKTNFTAGEISTELIGRGDLSAYDNGAAKLRNVRVIPTGGVTRRAGLRHVAELPGGGRLVAFEFNTEQVYLLAFTDARIAVYADETLVASLEAPWTGAQLAQLAWTQSADTLLLVHPDVAPKKLTRKGPGDWVLTDWKFYEKDGRVFQPFFKFVDDEVTLTPSGTSGTVTLTASADVFDAAHVGTRFRLADKEVEITGVSSALVASATVTETLAGTGATKDWEEQSFSPVRGYPVSVCFHQDRLVIGGSRDLTNRLWLSKSADLFNFDLGDAEDDEAIEFAILSDQVNAIRAVFSGRHLQIFTSGAEWMVTGDPLTPSAIQLKRQTRIGSPVDRSILPRDVDGATLFVSRSGYELREFLFADVEQAYQSNDLAVLSNRMMRQPVDQDFNKSERILYIVNGDGTLACVTVFRMEKVTAWSLMETQGAFQSVAVVGERVYVLTLREGTHRLERFDTAVLTDAAVTAAAEDDRTLWDGFGHLEGRLVDVVADGVLRDPVEVVDGAITLEQPARSIQAGLAYTHVVEPLPVFQTGAGGLTQGSAVRLVRATFRLFETAALVVDTGQGLRPLPFKSFGPAALDSPIQPVTADKSVRALGWTRGEPVPLWRIQQTDPLPSTVLSVLTEISTNG
ncbi:hypothetical protein HH303_12035 [Rhodospirillaceae bacterium KN72]|uniref:Uncharacterized protein n=1 Tax=Pacificispira spongiicola TaxID=2729598 RepID=A0A7Y0E143_9PROT|nr:hypothetical protein [Pacificispira spongiicola]NMM45213.1 hypothetical protein [Pacificispira spongiicola]